MEKHCPMNNMNPCDEQCAWRVENEGTPVCAMTVCAKELFYVGEVIAQAVNGNAE